MSQRLSTSAIRLCDGGVCDICHKTIKKNLNRHKTIIHSDDRPFNCCFCDKSFKTKGSLQQHEHGPHKNSIMHSSPSVIKRKQRSRVATMDVGIASLPNRLKIKQSIVCSCIVCNESFGSIADLELHLSVTHTPYAPFICDHCPNAHFETFATICDHYRNYHQLEQFKIRLNVNENLSMQYNRLQMLLDQCLSSDNTVTSTVVKSDRSSPTSVADYDQTVLQLSRDDLLQQSTNDYKIETTFDDQSSSSSSQPPVVLLLPAQSESTQQFIKTEHMHNRIEKDEEEISEMERRRRQRINEIDSKHKKNGKCTNNRPVTDRSQNQPQPAIDPLTYQQRYHRPSTVTIVQKKKPQSAAINQVKAPSTSNNGLSKIEVRQPQFALFAKYQHPCDESKPLKLPSSRRKSIRLPPRQCRICGLIMSPGTTNDYHVSTRHLQKPLYGCSQCHKKWYAKSRRMNAQHHIDRRCKGAELVIASDSVFLELYALTRHCFKTVDDTGAM